MDDAVMESLEDDVLFAGLTASNPDATGGLGGDDAPVRVVDLVATISDPSLTLSSQLGAIHTRGGRCDAWFTSSADAAAVGDDAAADTAERCPAHQFVLTARSRYFRALFRGPRNDSVSAADADSVEVEAPDSQTTLSRIMQFLYTGVLAPAPSDQLLQVRTSECAAAACGGLSHCRVRRRTSWPLTVTASSR
jgi:hypothetical protein